MRLCEELLCSAVEIADAPAVMPHLFHLLVLTSYKVTLGGTGTVMYIAFDSVVKFNAVPHAVHDLLVALLNDKVMEVRIYLGDACHQERDPL